MEEYPEELRSPPLPVVGLMGGLNTHAGIKRYLTTIRTDTGDSRPCLKLLSFELGATFAPKKNRKFVLAEGTPVESPRGGSHAGGATLIVNPYYYESYEPDGILKANWLHKHCNQLPAVLAVLFKWDSEGLKQWKTREQEILQYIETTRQNIRQRNIKLLVVLVVKSYLSPTDFTDERLKTLSKRAELDPRQIVLFSKKELNPSTRRLEKALQELAEVYYTEEIKRLKKDKDRLNKVTQPGLSVRLHFKIAFYSEILQNRHGALKYYLTAYNLLREMPRHRHRLTEIKVVADYLTFKICRLHFSLGQYTDAPKHFETHISTFRRDIGAPETEYEHHAWISRQYLVFAQLIELFSGGEDTASSTGPVSGVPESTTSPVVAGSPISPPTSPVPAGGAMAGAPAGAATASSAAGAAPSPAAAAAATPSLKKRINPGHYYFEAANKAVDRKRAARRLCDPYVKYPQVTKYSHLEPISLVKVEIGKQVYIGQPPSVILSHPLEGTFGPSPTPSRMTSSMVTIVPEADPEAVWQSIARELKFDHSGAIVSLLRKALESYKRAKAKRTTWFIASLLAQEYFLTGNNLEAKKNFDRIAKGYKREQWWLLHTAVLQTMLECTRRLGMTQDYLACALELVLEHMKSPLADKRNIQRNIIIVLTAPQLLVLPPLTQTYTVEVEHNHPLISANVRFLKTSANAHSDVPFEVTLRSHFPLPIRFSRLRVLFSDNQYDAYIRDARPITESEPSADITGAALEGDEVSASGDITHPLRGSLLLVPNEERRYLLSLYARDKGVVECTHLLLELGIPPQCVVFQWNVADWDRERVAAVNPVGEIAVDTVVPVGPRLLRVDDPEARVEVFVEHHPPVLFGEYYRMDFVLVNARAEEDRILNGQIDFDFEPAATAQDAGLTELPHFYMASEVQGENAGIPRGIPVRSVRLGAIAPGARVVQSIWLHFPHSRGGEGSVVASFHYETALRLKTSYRSVTPVSLARPFVVRFELFSSYYQTIAPSSGSIMAEEPFLLHAEIHSATQHPLEIVSADVVLKNNAQATLLSSLTPGKKAVLQKENKFSVWFHIVPKTSGEGIDFGQFVLQWRRAMAQGSHGNTPAASSDSLASAVPVSSLRDLSGVVTLHEKLPLLKVSRPPFSTLLDSPPHGVVGVGLPYTITLTNHTAVLQEFSLNVKENGAFLFAGDKESTFKVPPHGVVKLRHTLLPLVAGRVALPQFVVSAKRFENRELPGTKQTRFVFIRPQE